MDTVPKEKMAGHRQKNRKLKTDATHPANRQNKLAEDTTKKEGKV
jgi:hypothetical protein